MHSTMRMGSDPTNSVVDDTGETRAVRGLFIADNSALSNALGGPNPTLTTQAIATRTAEHIFVRYFGGRCWVQSGSPMCSTNPRVTRACIQRGL
jgi:choline dehydrogenase-like flavoprotein